MTWEKAGIRPDGTGERARRFYYQPYGELEFVDLPAAILTIAPGPFGVSFQCADGVLYWLTGYPDAPDTWIIRPVAKR